MCEGARATAAPREGDPLYLNNKAGGEGLARGGRLRPPHLNDTQDLLIWRLPCERQQDSTRMRERRMQIDRDGAGGRTKRNTGFCEPGFN